ncbi:hypothetical protein BU24DRAFT_420908 [Aaosphaeria arxii CBS 175.79]|uniref:Uncharacterized protein n=1 Tax=Aaosphaeria arxii CBS 175.79 TaxID=1450172 RepID=A0A6A5XY12_9PLEO|nr:uncharacterized protein BU24DRAFT_420908 [Aaosphaeria arxii CBS 175.79]KAF2017846.1 hypothetical protein BU24DRAFT_420908 [Aaosphaeria arxii CBS 175.79]
MTSETRERHALAAAVAGNMPTVVPSNVVRIVPFRHLQSSVGVCVALSSTTTQRKPRGNNNSNDIFTKLSRLSRTRQHDALRASQPNANPTSTACLVLHRRSANTHLPFLFLSSCPPPHRENASNYCLESQAWIWVGRWGVYGRPRFTGRSFVRSVSLDYH